MFGRWIGVAGVRPGAGNGAGGHINADGINLRVTPVER
jgi:hypothetical protein